MYVPREGTCTVCGKPIIKNNSNHKYCKECAKLMYNKTQEEHKRVLAMKRGLKAYGIDAKKNAGEENECHVKGSCVYGASGGYCDYMAIEGHSRIFMDGYVMKNGKCGAYRKKQSNRKKRRVPLPDSKVLDSGKLKEV